MKERRETKAKSLVSLTFIFSIDSINILHTNYQAYCHCFCSREQVFAGAGNRANPKSGSYCNCCLGFTRTNLYDLSAFIYELSADITIIVELVELIKQCHLHNLNIISRKNECHEHC